VIKTASGFGLIFSIGKKSENLAGQEKFPAMLEPV